ncbi:unnamed protein product, partial [Symbiodinium sp. KB8]
AHNSPLGDLCSGDGVFRNSLGHLGRFRGGESLQEWGRPVWILGGCKAHSAGQWTGADGELRRRLWLGRPATEFGVHRLSLLGGLVCAESLQEVLPRSLPWPRRWLRLRLLFRQ